MQKRKGTQPCQASGDITGHVQSWNYVVEQRCHGGHTPLSWTFPATSAWLTWRLGLRVSEAEATSPTGSRHRP